MMPSPVIWLEWLFISGALLTVLLVMLMGVRRWLFVHRHRPGVVLNLWWAIPGGLCLMVCCSQLISYQVMTPHWTLNLSVGIADGQTQGSSINWPWVLFLLWLGIAVHNTIRLFHNYWQLKSRIMRHSERMAPDVYQCALNTSPMAMGLLHPIVVIPAHLSVTLNQQQLEMVLLHERVHCARRDPMWRFLLAFLRAWYWFVPIKTIIGQALIKDQEYACDERVIQKINDKAGYAKLLLGLSQLSDTDHSNGLVCSSSFQIKDRIMKLNTQNNQNSHWSITGLFVIMVLMTGSIPAWAEFSSQATKKEPLVPLSTVAPKYPLKAYQEKLSGEVVVSFVVNQQGLVEEARVIKSSHGTVFDQAAIAAVSQWTFEPLSQARKATQTVRFNLD